MSVLYSPSRTIASARGIVRDFQSGTTTIHALRNVDVDVEMGEVIALRGRSGSGKTTLLNILVGLDDPTSGEVIVLGRRLRVLNEAQRAKLRRERIGMLFQNAHLFPSLTAQENVEIPLRLEKVESRERARRSLEALRLVNLEGRARHRGMELSGGEQQRVALARALVHQPQLVVADEPTGNLDSMTGQIIVTLLRDIAHSQGIGFLIATHDATVVNIADRILQIQDGQLAEVKA
jgi:ABC-type lipoprotein export system ATPase subunit